MCLCARDSESWNGEGIDSLHSPAPPTRAGNGSMITCRCGLDGGGRCLFFLLYEDSFRFFSVCYRNEMEIKEEKKKRYIAQREL